jgi:hypothetical protein
MFAGEPRKDIETAFQATLDILQGIGKVSQQAQLYYGILHDFSHAITKYRERVDAELRRTVRHYLERIIPVDREREIGQQRPDSAWPGHNHDTTAFGVSDLGRIEDFRFSRLDDGTNENAFYWDNFDIQLHSPEIAEELEELERLLYCLE